MSLLERVKNLLSRVENEVERLSTKTFVDYTPKLKKLRLY